jgi:hypothetical protein
MKSCSGTDRANSAADPDWWAQLEVQLQAASLTIDEINDPDLQEAFEAFDRMVDDRKRAAKALDHIRETVAEEAGATL